MNSKGGLDIEPELEQLAIKGNIPDINNPEEVLDRLNKLVLDFEKSRECVHAFRKLDKCYNEIKHCLPGHIKGSLINKVDDCFVEILVLYENYFYKQGYIDGRRWDAFLKEKRRAGYIKNTLIQKVQELRSALENEIEKSGLNNDRVLEISGQLDNLLIEYYEMIQKEH